MSTSVKTVHATTSHWCETVYDAKAAQILLYGRALGLSHSESEDVLHETFVALLKLAGAPEEPEHYCLRAFRNRALNFRRSMWRRLTRELESSRWFERNSGGETPQERAAMRCLQEIPAEQREVIVLKIWHEHTFEVIGGLLEISPNTAAGRYRYGMEKLRACLTENKVYESFEFNGESAAFLDAASSRHAKVLKRGYLPRLRWIPTAHRFGRALQATPFRLWTQRAGAWSWLAPLPWRCSVSEFLSPVRDASRSLRNECLADVSWRRLSSMEPQYAAYLGESYHTELEPLGRIYF